MDPRSSRRQFLKSTTAGLAAPLILPTLGRGADSPNGKINHAAIGVDGQGWSDLTQIASHPQCEIVAICDVDTARMKRAAEKFPQARKYQDWRELLEKEGDKIDSVNVTVPDHMHAPISISAMNLGKHCYTEKPLTHEVHEARQMRLAAEKNQVVTQMGNQIHSSIEYRSGAIMIQQGVIGKVKEVHAWSGAKFPQRGRPPGEDPVPATLDWDKWVGVAPMRPYKNKIYHPFNWRAWIDFGGGAIGDFGCHILDTPFKALQLTAPTSIKATVPQEWAEKPGWHTEHWPDWEMFEYSFPGTKYTAGDALKVTWYDGEKRPPRELFPFEKENRQIPGGGSLFVGETGVLLLPHFSAPQLVPYSKNRGVARPKLKGMNHYHNFVDGCLGKAETGSHFGFAGPLTEAVLLGNVANRFAGKELAWDTESLKVTNVPGANKLIRREYREGWKI